MSIIKVYSDELYCNDKTFKLSTLIWGSPSACNQFEKEITELVGRNRTVLGENFKEFHAVNLSERNFNKVGPVYDQLLGILTDSIAERGLGVISMLISAERYKNNGTYLKDWVKKMVTDRNSELGKQFASLKDADLPALYHRVDQLFPLLFYREIMGDPGDEFELYPDSIGKILNYKDEEFPMTGTLPVTLPMNFYKIVQLFSHSLMRILPLANFEGWPKSEQSLNVFEPTASEASYLIQSCDIVSNLLFNHIRYMNGLTDKKYELKSKLLGKHINLLPIEADIKTSFKKIGEEINCVNDKLWNKIVLRKT